MTSVAGRRRKLAAGRGPLVAPVLASLLLLLGVVQAWAQAPQLEVLEISIDVDFELNPLVTFMARDDDLITIDFNRGESVARIPAWQAADVDAAYADGPGKADKLVSFDTRVELPGGVVAHPGDVVAVSAAADELIIYFDHVLAGLADTVDVDAVDLNDEGLVLSFATTTVIHAGQPDELIVADEDLVRYVEYDELPVVVFDGSAHGVAEALDLDAAHFLEDGRLLVSFDVSGTLPGGDGPIDFEDEDVLAFDAGNGTWSMVWDGSTFYPGIRPVDVDAIAYAAYPPVCVGDCSSNRFVDRSELILGVSIALLRESLAQCSQFDPDHSLTVTVDELVRAVLNAQNFCALEAPLAGARRRISRVAFGSP